MGNKKTTTLLKTSPRKKITLWYNIYLLLIIMCQLVHVELNNISILSRGTF